MRASTLATTLERDRAARRAARLERVVQTLRERAERSSAAGRPMPGARTTIAELSEELVALRRRLDRLPPAR